MNKRFLTSIVLITIGFVLISISLTMKNKSHTLRQPFDKLRVTAQGENVMVSSSNHQDDKVQGDKTVTLGGETFKVEVVATPAARAQGLSGRDPLPADVGMLFVFDEPAVHGFWMKDMKFALDIIWIMDGKVVDIWQAAPPPVDENIPRYRPEKEADYVFEVNAGFVERSGLQIGDEVSIDLN